MKGEGSLQSATLHRHVGLWVDAQTLCVAEREQYSSGITKWCVRVQGALICMSYQIAARPGWPSPEAQNNAPGNKASSSATGTKDGRENHEIAQWEAPASCVARKCPEARGRRTLGRSD